MFLTHLGTHCSRSLQGDVNNDEALLDFFFLLQILKHSWRAGAELDSGGVTEATRRAAASPSHPVLPHLRPAFSPVQCPPPAPRDPDCTAGERWLQLGRKTGLAGRKPEGH